MAIGAVNARKPPRVDDCYTSVEPVIRRAPGLLTQITTIYNHKLAGIPYCMFDNTTV